MRRYIYLLIVFFTVGFRVLSQNVGIGTVSPAYKLDVVGSGRYAGDIWIDLGTNTAEIAGETNTGMLIDQVNLKVHLEADATTCLTGTDAGNVGIGTTAPSNSSILELSSTNKGFLVPRMTAAQRTGITSPATGLLVYQTDGETGFWFYNGTIWKQLGGVEKIDDLLDGKSDSDGTQDGSSVFLGLSAGINDDQSNNQNVGMGYQALYSNTSGVLNVAIGYQSLYSNTTGTTNSALGYRSLYLNTTGYRNVGVGASSLINNTSGYKNVAVGVNALTSNSIGYENIGLGAEALQYNTSGYRNVAVGFQALFHNTTGNYNLAAGYNALHDNTVGNYNLAYGAFTLDKNTSGDNNIAIGTSALRDNLTGVHNVALGSYALNRNTTGDYNIAIGSSTLTINLTGNYNTVVGASSGLTVSSPVYSSSTALGHMTGISASNQVRIGSNTVTSIGGFVNWTNVSDERFKTNIKANVPGLDFINQLKPITYNLDVEKVNQYLGLPDSITKTDEFLIESMKKKSEMVQSGFLAQDVEKAANALGYNFSGVDKPKNNKDYYGLRYAEFVVPLVKAVQELNTKLEKENAELKAKNKELEEKIDWIMSQIKK